MSDAEVDGLQRCLAAEHAAVYGYGVLGGRLAGDGRSAVPDLERAQASYATHRELRDSLVAALEGLGAEPAAADAAYGLPFTPVSAAACARLARYLEGRCCEAYAFAVSVTSGELRSQSAHWLIDAADRSMSWGSAPQAFPGRPDL